MFTFAKHKRQMTKELKPFMYSHDLEWYFDEKNVKNQELLTETFNYFNEGEGKPNFKPLVFLNLFWKQFDITVKKIESPKELIEDLNRIPLSEKKKHILFGFILKWCGGYPVNNINEQYDITLKEIQKEFLNYQGVTPEKEFCKVNSKQTNELMKLGIAYTTAINNNLNVVDILAAMNGKEQEKKIVFHSFDTLYEAMLKDKILAPSENETLKLIDRSKCNFNFNVWLQESKGWEYGNNDQYRTFLSREIFKEFLDFEYSLVSRQIIEENRDTRFWLVDFLENKAQISNAYKGFQSTINNYGYLEMTIGTDKVKVYTPELALIFTSRKLRAENMDTNKETLIDGFEYSPNYITSFKKGREYFNSKFAVQPNVIYGPNAEHYVNDIHLNYFHIENNDVNKGWHFVKKEYPFIITHKAISEFGYYSGIVSAVDEMVKKHPKQFQNFYRCEHDELQQQTQTDTEQLQADEFIVKHLGEYKAAFNSESDYLKAVNAISSFFQAKQNTIKEPLFVKNGNIKNIAYAMGEIWRSKENKIITIEYLQLYKQVFSIFKNQKLNKSNIFSNNLYKYSITKT